MTLKGTPSAIETLFNQLLLESDPINSIEYCTLENPLFMQLPVVTACMREYAKTSDHPEYYQDWIDSPSTGMIHPKLDYINVVKFGWTTKTFARLIADTDTDVIMISGGRRSIVDRFARVISLGIEHNFELKPGLALVSYESTRLDWYWHETQASKMSETQSYRN